VTVGGGEVPASAGAADARRLRIAEGAVVVGRALGSRGRRRRGREALVVGARSPAQGAPRRHEERGEGGQHHGGAASPRSRSRPRRVYRPRRPRRLGRHARHDPRELPARLGWRLREPGLPRVRQARRRHLDPGLRVPLFRAPDERIDERIHRRKPRRRILLQRPRYHGGDPRLDSRHRRERWGRRLENLRDERVRAPLERPKAGSRQELVRDHSPRELVGPPVDRVAANLLGRHVDRRADNRPLRAQGGDRVPLRRRHRIGRRREGPLRDAEVEDLHDPVVADHHVLGLHVAVHEAGGVRGRERARHLLEPPHADPHPDPRIADVLS
jgi:hypothetical protein